MVPVGDSVVASALKKLARTCFLSCHDVFAKLNWLLLVLHIACCYFRLAIPQENITWWCPGGVPVVSASQWCPGRVPAVFQWCPGSGVWQWCSGGVPVVFRWFSRGVAVRVAVVSRWCSSGVAVVLSGGVPVVFRWCFSGVQWCPGGVPVVPRWCPSGVPVVSQSCPACFLDAESNELRKRYLIPKADTSQDDLGKPESGGTSIPIPDLYYDWMKIGRLKGTAIPVLGLHYDEMKIEPTRKSRCGTAAHASWRCPSVECKQVP